LSDVGFIPQWVGDIRFARNLEAIAELWMNMAYGEAARDNADFAFAIVNK
jgi:predicted dinucleotide-binding enzyme